LTFFYSKFSLNSLVSLSIIFKKCSSTLFFSYLKMSVISFWLKCYFFTNKCESQRRKSNFFTSSMILWKIFVDESIPAVLKWNLFCWNFLLKRITKNIQPLSHKRPIYFFTLFFLQFKLRYIVDNQSDWKQVFWHISVYFTWTYGR